MDGCLFHLLLCFSFNMLAVADNNPVLSTSDVTENEPFFIYCNVHVAGAPDHVVYVQILSTYRKTTTSADYSMIASIRSKPPPGGNITVANKPHDANWTFVFEGTQETQLGDKQLMKIQIQVNNAQCKDSGLYFCRLSYFFNVNEGSLQLNSTPEALKVWSKTSNFNLTYQPNPTRVDNGDSSHLIYESGTSVSLNCSCKGPKGLVINWRMLVKDPRTNGYSDSPLPKPPNHLDPLIHMTPVGCFEYLYVSTLTAEVKASSAYIYKCDVRNQTGLVFTKRLALSSPEADEPDASSSPKLPCDPAMLLVVSIVCFFWFSVPTALKI